MKIIVAAFVLTLFSVSLSAQNISLNTLIRVNAMQPAEANGFFNSSYRQFELSAADNSKGYILYQYKNKPNDITRQEVISTGAVTQTATGEVLHQISYWSNYYWFIEGLRRETEKAGYNLKLRGHDNSRNLWFYENDEFTINFYISKDQSQGTLVINQKHAPAAEAF